jgi:hypothetical protein
MKTVNIAAAKTHLPSLVEEAAAGNEIIIAKAGKARARLVPLAPVPRKRSRDGSNIYSRCTMISMILCRPILPRRSEWTREASAGHPHVALVGVE